MSRAKRGLTCRCRRWLPRPLTGGHHQLHAGRATEAGAQFLLHVDHLEKRNVDTEAFFGKRWPQQGEWLLRSYDASGGGRSRILRARRRWGSNTLHWRLLRRFVPLKAPSSRSMSLRIGGRERRETSAAIQLMYPADQTVRRPGGGGVRGQLGPVTAAVGVFDYVLAVEPGQRH